MADYLELWMNGAQERIPLEGERVTLGHSAENDLPLPYDPTVSRVHAVLERVGRAGRSRTSDRETEPS